VYLLTPKIFDVIKRLKPSWRNELEITDTLQMMLEEKQKIIYNTVETNWKDTGTPEDIIQANNIILNKMTSFFGGIKEDKVITSGKVIVGKNSILKEGSEIIGPVIIGENCIIGKNCIIGPNTSIGDDSKISNSNLENTIVMKNCKIDYNNKIKNSIISNDSEILEKHSKESSKVFLLGEGTKITL